MGASLRAFHLLNTLTHVSQTQMQSALGGGEDVDGGYDGVPREMPREMPTHHVGILGELSSDDLQLMNNLHCGAALPK